LVSCTGQTCIEELGTTSPKSKVASSGYSVTSSGSNPWNTNASSQYAFLFGGIAPTEPEICPVGLACDSFSTVRVGSLATLTTDQAASLDSKMDDGKPAYGKVQAASHDAMPNCTTSSTASSSDYNASASGKNCSLVFNAGF
jgi:hypothetical protein